jgi:hypothetical protein
MVSSQRIEKSDWHQPGALEIDGFRVLFLETFLCARNIVVAMISELL